MLKLVLILFLYFLRVIFAAAQSQQQTWAIVQPEDSVQCTTPNNDLGVCVEVQNCSIFVSALTSGKKESYEFIRESRCGLENADLRRIKVCCGKYDDYLEKEKNKTSPSLPNQNLFPNECGIHDIGSTTTLVVGGTQTLPGEHPWMARLRHRQDNGVFRYGCAGFLISKQFVVTAAHCIRSKELAPFGPAYQVQLGAHNTRTDPDCGSPLPVQVECADPTQLLKTADPIVHPDYTGDLHQHNDIALIPLKECAIFTKYVRPICLARTHFEEPRLTVSGWGKTETSDSSHIKLKVNLPRVERDFCALLYNHTGRTILESQFCAGGDPGRDSCQGDSGGPIMVPKFDGQARWYAEGIVSMGRGCGLAGWPGVYTSIPYFMPWIEMKMNQYLDDKQRVEQKQESENSCTTPNGEKAQCVSIYNCTLLRDVLTTNLNPEKIRFLQESQCGYDKQPYVCCGSVDGFQVVTNKS